MDFCSSMCGQLLLSEVQKDSNHNNVVVSPLSFHAILNMIAAGATGHTLQQMLSFLGCDNVQDLKSKFSEMMNVGCNNNDENNNDGNGPVVSFVNGVWVDTIFPLTDSYRKFVKSFCKAEARNFDFATQAEELVAEANLWAKNETRGLVTDVLNKTDITPDAVCLLGNALYFKGAWKEKFNPNRTKQMDFYLLSGEKVSAPFMTGCTDYLYGWFDGYKVVKIPYRTGAEDNKQFAMYILLPKEKDGLGNLLQLVDADPGFFGQNFKLRKQKLDIFWIPMFKFSYKTDQGRKTIMKMGLTLPFNKDCRELTEIVDIGSDKSFYFSNVFQKASIEVDEEGTEAAAVTFGVAGPRCERPLTKFVADHPFMFMIREESSGLVLFTGAVLNPCSDGE